MAPAFDRRSMESYAPVITGVTSELLARWGVLPNLSEVDVGAAMMHTTLHVISRTMFSANSDEIVDVVERGVGRYQTTVRPSLLDLLGFPAWFTKLFSSRRGTAAVFNEFDKAVVWRCRGWRVIRRRPSPPHLDARRINGDGPLLSLDPSVDGVSYAPVVATQNCVLAL